MFGIRRSAAVVIMLIVAVVAGTATAYSYWTADGSGSGTATVAKIRPLEITQVTLKDLVPGKERELTGTVSNPNDFPVNIAQHRFTVDASVVPSSLTRKFEENFELVAPTDHDAVVPANGDANFSGGSITLLDLPTVDQLVWQNAVITLSYTLAPQ